MKIQTPHGEAEGQPLSDIQEYNRRLEMQGNWLKALVILGYLAFLFVLWVTYYIISRNVVNNIVARCV